MNEFQRPGIRIYINHHSHMTYRGFAHTASAEKYQIAHLCLREGYLRTLRSLKTRSRTQSKTEFTVNMACKTGAIKGAWTFGATTIPAPEIGGISENTPERGTSITTGRDSSPDDTAGRLAVAEAAANTVINAMAAVRIMTID